MEVSVEEQVESVSHWIDVLMEFAVTYGFQIFGALLFLLIGLKVASWIASRAQKLAVARHINVTLASFMGSAVKLVMIGFVIIITLGNFGITIAPLIALAGAGAFGATLAVQGLLANYGAGFSIILTQPFVIGNTITVNRGTSGVVEEIKLAYTILRGEDNEIITVPNKEIVGKVIVNSEKNRVVESKVCIDQDADTEQAISAVLKAVSGISGEMGAAASENVSENESEEKIPEPQVGIHDFTYGGIILGVRFWVPSRQYFRVRYAMNGAILKALKEAEIPLLKAGAVAVALPGLSADEAQTEEESAIGSGA